MKTSENGVELIKRFEGLELEAYQDIAGIWTIGYGHTGSDVQPGMKISERDAEELLRRDLKPREQAVEGAVKVPLNQNEFDALVSFAYNVLCPPFAHTNRITEVMLTSLDACGYALEFCTTPRALNSYWRIAAHSNPLSRAPFLIALWTTELGAFFTNG